MKRYRFFDSTLRDGAQAENITFTVEDKLNIVKSLDKWALIILRPVILAPTRRIWNSFPGSRDSSPEPREAGGLWLHPPAWYPGGGGQNVQALLTADTEAIAIFGKSWDLHVAEIKTTPEENLRMITDTISFFVSRGKTVFFDAEHFFDGYKANPEYALQTLYAAERAGATCLVLCDTNGGCFPDEISAIVADVVSKVNAPVGIHCHDDIIAQWQIPLRRSAGAVQVQGTYIGYGERCGNANLSTIIPSLQCKLGYECHQRAKWSG